MAAPEEMRSERRGLLVTGGTGYLASHFIARVLDSRTTPVTAVVRSTPETLGAGRLLAALRTARTTLGDRETRTGDLTAIEGDVCLERCGVRDDVVRELRAAGVDEMWHFAADLRYEEAHRSAIWRTNVDGARHALALARLAGVRRFVYVSTAYAAGVASGEIGEVLHDPRGPFNNVYEESKCTAEHLLTDECRATDLPLTIVRPSVVIGPRTTRSPDGTTSGLYGLIRAVAGVRHVTARASGPIRIPATPDAEVNFIPVDALTADMMSIRETAGGLGIYHLTARRSVTVAECLDVIASVSGLRNVVLRPKGSFEPNALERRIARRVEFYLGYLHAGQTFARRLPSRWEMDRAEFERYVVAAHRGPQAETGIDDDLLAADSRG